MKRIRELLQTAIMDNRFPGCHYALVTKDSVMVDYIGYKSLLPTKEPLIGDEIYDIASLTKVIATTSTIMKLVEEGVITLDQKVSTLLPRFKHLHISIKHLLTHQSGLPADVKGASKIPDETSLFNIIYDMDLIYETTKDVVYSDIGFILLGKIIETVTNKRLDQVVTEKVLKPLKMTDTSYQPSVDRTAPTEFRDDLVFKGLLKGQVHDEKAFLLNGLAGHAGLFSTAFDIGKFIKAILNDEFILSPEMTRMLFEPQITTDHGGVYVCRTLGWLKPYRKGFAGDEHDFFETIGHTGFTGCHMFIDKKNGVGFVLLSNAVHPKRELNGIIGLRNEIGNLVYQITEDL